MSHWKVNPPGFNFIDHRLRRLRGEDWATMVCTGMFAMEPWAASIDEDAIILDMEREGAVVITGLVLVDGDGPVRIECEIDGRKTTVSKLSSSKPNAKVDIRIS